MDINEIVRFWTKQLKTPKCWWLHPRDRELLEQRPNSFKLDFPAAPFVGNIVGAPIVVLVANPGYHSTATPYEFRCGEVDINRHLKQIQCPDTADWTGAGGSYYQTVNYGHMILEGKLAVVDVCAYRSCKISQERPNQKLLDELPSVQFTRKWLINCILPLANNAERLIVAKRPKLWGSDIENMLRRQSGVIFDEPRFRHMKRKTVKSLEHYIEKLTTKRDSVSQNTTISNDET